MEKKIKEEIYFWKFTEACCSGGGASREGEPMGAGWIDLTLYR